MVLLDLEEPRFTQAQVLEMVPSLTAKTLQNWNARGIVHQEGPAPGRQGKRLYTGAGVIGLRFLVGATELGIAPADAATMVEPVLQHALNLHEAYPAQDDGSGNRSFIILGGSPELYCKAYIYRFDVKYSIMILREDRGLTRVFMPKFYIVSEIDYIIVKSLDDIYRAVFGPRKELANSDLTAEQYEAMEAALVKFDPSKGVA